MLYKMFILSCGFVLFTVPLSKIHAIDSDKNITHKETTQFSSQNPLKIAMIQNYPPLSMPLPNGEPTGYYVDVWKLWSKVSGVPIEIIPQEYNQNIDAIKSDKVDMVAGLFINEERQTWAEFSLPIARVRSAIYFTSDRVEMPTLANMNGEKIAVLKGTYQEFYIRENYPDIQVVSFSHTKETLLNLLDGKFDAVIGEIPFVNAQMGLLGVQGLIVNSGEIILANTSHGMIRKGNPELLTLINQGLKNIPIDQLLALEKKWLPSEPSYFGTMVNKNVPSLTIRENEWLANNSELKLGVSPNLLPFESLDEKGNYSGISSDYIRLIEEKLLIQMFPQKDLSWTEVLELAKQKQIDIIPAIVETKERNSYLGFTEPYMNVPLVIATSIKSPIIKGLDDLNGKIVGVEANTPAENILRQNHPELILKTYRSVNIGLINLEDGDIDAFVHDLVIITYQQNQRGIDDIQIAAFTPYELNISMGVRKGLEPLVGILEKTLLTIDNKARHGIANHWIAIQVNFATQLRTLLIWLLPLACFMFAIIYYVVRTNRKLKFEVETRKQKEKSLEETKTNAENASKVKDDFLANMSHELRTPMNAIIGMSQLIEQTNITNSQKQHIGTVLNSANSLLGLINDILDLSKVQAGKMQLESISFRVESMIESVKRQVDFGGGTQGVKHVINIMHDVPKKLAGDKLRIMQVLSNLIENAKKFTESGIIELNVSCSRIGKNKMELHFAVKDTGIGMSSEQISKLFDVYNQVDASSTRKYEGVGIGLSLCKKLCELMNGELWVTSQLNSGSEFHFTAKLSTDESHDDKKSKDSPIHKSTIEGAEQRSLEGKRVLVVDDNITNQLVAGKMLERANVEVFKAKNGMECLLMLSENSFDAILMDIQMPIMDGYTATKKLRENNKNDDLPVIALSANVGQSDIDKALSSGMNEYLEKPINSKKLLTTLEKCIYKLDR